jgi:heat shock protein HtpX
MPIEPEPQPAPRAQARRLEADEQLRIKVRAYPGTLTYLDLMRKNRRDSVLLMILMVVMGVAIGGIIASALAVYAGADVSPEDLIPSVLLGCLVALVLSVLGATWSWFGGASAILAMQGARQLRKEDDPELFNVVEEMSIAAGLPMPRVYMINDTAMNAFATGRDARHAAVAITRGLREHLSRDELQGVMAHEVAHIRHLDVRFAMLMATMVGLIVFACDAFLRIAWHSGGRGARRRSGKSEGGAAIVLLVIALLLAVLAPIAATIIQMAYSRRREFLADAGAVELTRNPLGLASALDKLSHDHEPLVDTANRGTAHMYIVNPLRKMRDAEQSLNSLFLSHPPVKERIARLMALAR